jgi:hypothetical protein
MHVGYHQSRTKQQRETGSSGFVSIARFKPVTYDRRRFSADGSRQETQQVDYCIAKAAR